MVRQASPTQAEWDAQKDIIRHLYLVKRLKREEVVRILRKRGFYVTPRQFDKQTTKWGFRQNINGRAWRFVGHQIKKRKAQHKRTEILVSDYLVPEEKVNNEVRRHEQLLPMALSPVLEPGMPVVIRTPRDVQIEIPWPTSLPWLDFQLSGLQLFQQLIDIEVHSKYASGLTKATNLIRPIPSFDGANSIDPVKENAGNGAFQLIQACIFYLANGDRNGKDVLWEAFVLMVSRFGLARLPVFKHPHDLTTFSFLHRVLSKAHTKLFWDCERPYADALLPERRRTYMCILHWVFQCGLDPATPVRIQEDHKPIIATVLQFAAFARRPDVVKLVLHAGADPCAENYLASQFTIKLSPLELALTPELVENVNSIHLYSPHNSCRGFKKVLGILCKEEVLITANRKQHQLKAAVRAGCMGLARRLVDQGASWHFEMPSEAESEGWYGDVVHVDFETAFTAATRLRNFKCRQGHLNFDSSRISSPHYTPWFHASDVEIASADSLEEEWFSIAHSNSSTQDEDSEDSCFGPSEDYGSLCRSYTQPQVEELEEHVLRTLHTLLDVSGHKKSLSQNIGCWRPSDVAVIAAYRGFNRVLQWLLDEGSDLQCANSHGVTPWLAALRGSRRSTCQFLYEANALSGLHGPVALQMTIWMGELQVLEDLFAARMDFESPPDAELLSSAIFDLPRQSYSRYMLSTTNALDLALHMKYSKACRMLILAGAQMTSGVLGLAAEKNDIELAKLALKADVDINQEDSERHWTPLQIAVNEESLSVARLLLDCGASLCGNELILAMQPTKVEAKPLKVVSLLIQHGANPHLRSTNGETCFELALQGRDARLVEWASVYWPREYDPGVLCAAVIWALRTSDDQYVRLLLSLRPLDQEASVVEATAVALATRHAWQHSSTCGESILELLLVHIPASTHCYISEKLASALGDFRNWIGDRTYTHLDGIPHGVWRRNNNTMASPWSVAILSGVPHGWDRLSAYGFYPDQYALLCAIKLRRSDMVTKFLSIGVLGSEPPGVVLSSPVLAAVCVRSCEILELLLQHGYRAGERHHPYHPTPLQEAIKEDSEVMIRALLDEGPDVSANAGRHQGGTALQYAAIHNHLDLARELISRGSLKDINAHRSPFEGRTALEGASEHGRLDMVDFLLSYGAKTSGSGQRQYLRAIKFAKSENHIAVLKLLKNHRQWTKQDETRWKEDEELMEEDCPETDDDYPVSECSDDDCNDKHFPSFWKRRVQKFPGNTPECLQKAEDTFFSENWLMEGVEESRGEVLTGAGSWVNSPEEGTTAHTAAGNEYRYDTEPWAYNCLEADDYSSFLEYESLMLKDH
ncbi:ankyrin repeats (3 copies) domain-containing protein [Sarocladium implicatum]|nr:ankyrin repeats (3 copies) domain-containing protein [Sarocladium implicatum]